MGIIVVGSGCVAASTEAHQNHAVFIVAGVVVGSIVVGVGVAMAVVVLCTYCVWILDWIIDDLYYLCQLHFSTTTNLLQQQNLEFVRFGCGNGQKTSKGTP